MLSYSKLFYWLDFQLSLKKGSKDGEQTLKMKKKLFLENLSYETNLCILYSFESFVEFRQSLDIGCERNLFK